MSTEVTKVEETQMQTAPATAETLISQAIEKGVDVAVMERLYALRTEMKKEWAKEQFDLAMANFQGVCPVIKKTKSVPTSSGQVAYSYAPIDVVVSQVRGLLKQNGLSYTIKTEVGTDKVKSICIVKHISGHNEESEMEVPFGVKTNVMSNSQVVAAASTFSKRYAFLNAFGIMTGDDDNEQALNVPDEKFVDEIAKITTIKDLKAYHTANKKKFHSKAYAEAINAKNKELKDFIPVIKK